ncbi:Uncharacterised protein [Mycobacteroides abscessus]|nr:Uncharacterised protein [Mycobacteroides abscessus]
MASPPTTTWRTPQAPIRASDSASSHNRCHTAVGKSSRVGPASRMSCTSALRSADFIAAERMTCTPRLAATKTSSTLISDVSGAHCRMRSCAHQPYASPAARTNSASAPWEIGTSLGRPVDPEVAIMYAVFSARAPSLATCSRRSATRPRIEASSSVGMVTAISTACTVMSSPCIAIESERATSPSEFSHTLYPHPARWQAISRSMALSESSSAHTTMSPGEAPAAISHPIHGSTNLRLCKNSATASSLSTNQAGSAVGSAGAWSSPRRRAPSAPIPNHSFTVIAIGMCHIASIELSAPAILSATHGWALAFGRSLRCQMDRVRVRRSSSATQDTVMPSTGPMSVTRGAAERKGRSAGAHVSRMKLKVNASTCAVLLIARYMRRYCSPRSHRRREALT